LSLSKLLLSSALLSAAIPVLLTGCSQTTYTANELCDVLLTTATPTAASPGDTVILAATPLTTDYDTALFVGGVRAQITSVDRSDDCDICDACREEYECLTCGDCDDCDAQCDAECVETVTFVVPEVAPGETIVQIYNAFGGSQPLSLEILEAGSSTDDTGPDTGADTATGTDTSR